MAKKNGVLHAKEAHPKRATVEAQRYRSFPTHTLEQALQILRAIGDEGAAKSMDRILLAKAVDRTPNSSEFRSLLSSSLKYGLTTGTEKADYISPTPLGLRIIRPQSDSERRAALIEAAMHPDFFGNVLNHYNRNKLPTGEFFHNALVRTFNIPEHHASDAATCIQQNAAYVGILEQVGSAYYVRIDKFHSLPAGGPAESELPAEENPPNEPATVLEAKPDPLPQGSMVQPSDLRAKRVFVTHGKNRGFIEPIKKLLRFGELEAVVSAERESVSQPVPDKVMGDMRGCGAAIIHIDDETRLVDSQANEHVVLNPNVLIEIGAAMALYGRRFILLVKDGLRLPTNLQGLYEVRYQGDTLDGAATIKLLEAINEIKNFQLSTA
ncbi:MAG: nucleotide-binding protein [Phycisphaerales bacterium]|nr:nucleotide-binding protein [Phycisphaerales bacterium]